MKAKEYLQKLKRLDTLIDQKQKEYDDLRLMSTSIGSIEMKERVQSSAPQAAPFERIVQKMIDLQAEINSEIDLFVDEKDRVIKEIQQIKNLDEMKVLYKRYVEYKSFEQIAVDMNFTIRNIHFIHGKALNSFTDMFLNT